MKISVLSQPVSLLKVLLIRFAQVLFKVENYADVML